MHAGHSVSSAGFAGHNSCELGPAGSHRDQGGGNPCPLKIVFLPPSLPPPLRDSVRGRHLPSSEERSRESNQETDLGQDSLASVSCAAFRIDWAMELEKGESMDPNWEAKRTGLIKVSTLEGVAGGSQWVREEYASLYEAGGSALLDLCGRVYGSGGEGWDAALQALLAEAQRELDGGKPGALKQWMDRHAATLPPPPAQNKTK